MLPGIHQRDPRNLSAVALAKVDPWFSVSSCQKVPVRLRQGYGAMFFRCTEKRKCRTTTWGCCPAFSRCAAANTELCVTASFSLSSGFFRFQSLNGMSGRNSNLEIRNPKVLQDLAVDLSLRKLEIRNSKSEINQTSKIKNQTSKGFLLRKEVIQPQVPLRLPCYDFIPVTAHSVEGCLPCGLARRLRLQATSMM